MAITSDRYPDRPLDDHELDYLFDLHGCLILRDALTADQLARVNAWVDEQPQDLPPGTWLGQVETHTYSGAEGVNYQNVREAGPVFEELLDNPAWIRHVRRWIENDYNQIAIQEDFLNVRRAGGFIGMHSGGHTSAPVLSFRHHQTGAWAVGQINILVALTDIGPGDGATMVIPGSHKSAIPHPDLTGRQQAVYRSDRSVDGALMAEEVHLQAGEAVLFTDAICHGSSERVTDGERRVLIYRYSPHTIAPRYRYLPSPEFLERLTPERRAIVEPVPPKLAPGQVLRGPAEQAVV